MFQRVGFFSGQRRLSLSFYISLLLALTATVPLMVTIGSLVVFLRPALISQASSAMLSNAQTRVQLIDSYLSERSNDINTLSESTSIRAFLAGNQASTGSVMDTLFTTQHRDVANYLSLSLLSLQQNVMLFYPSAPIAHGSSPIASASLLQLQSAQQVVFSPVFYDQVGNVPSIDLYARVTDSSSQTLGFVRASLSLQRVWSPVDSADSGGYNFILDQNGIRIAYTNPDHSGFTRPSALFTAVSPPSRALQQQIIVDNFYGNNDNAVSTVADPALAAIQHDDLSNAVFQFVPAGQQQTFEAARYRSSVVPWTYFTLTPLASVTGIADQQLLRVILIIGLMLVLALVVGLIVGRRVALPILRSVSLLHKNSAALKLLAEEENVMATEQTWMLEASEATLESVRYYTNATSVAVQQIQRVGTELAQNQRDLHFSTLNTALHQMLEAALYIERATKHQETMNERLQTSLRVTTQTTEQLTKGAKSTNTAAIQLEFIVDQLTSVVGQNVSETASNEDEMVFNPDTF